MYNSQIVEIFLFKYSIYFLKYVKKDLFIIYKT